MGFLSLSIENRCLEKRSLHGILALWIIRIDHSALGPKLELEITVAPLPNQILGWLLDLLRDDRSSIGLGSLMLWLQDLRRIFVVF